MMDAVNSSDPRPVSPSAEMQAWNDVTEALTLSDYTLRYVQSHDVFVARQSHDVFVARHHASLL